MIERSSLGTTDEEILPFHMNHVPEFFQKKAEIELSETAEIRIKKLQELKDLIRNDKNMSHMQFEEDFLIQYLRGRKFSASKAFKYLKAFVNFRKKNSEIFTGLSYEKTVMSMTDEIATFLPNRCHEGCAILLVELDNWQPETFPLEEAKRMLATYFLGASQDVMTQINGFKMIVDVKSNPIRLLRFCTPQNIYMLYHGVQDCVPARYKEIHIMNNSIVFRAAWMVAKPFLSEKIKKRFIFHDKNETLVDYFPAAVLPIKYGGTLKDYSMCDWLKTVMEPHNLEKIFGGNFCL